MGRRRGEPKNPKSCHERALGLLAVRSRTRKELRTRLLAARFEPTEVEDVLDRLERVGLVDDGAFVDQFVTHQLDVKLSGRRAVLSGLMAKGVSPELAAAAIARAADGEQARAERLADAKVTRMSGVEPAKAFTRLTGLLQRRGYSPDIARSAARRALSVESSEE